MTRDFAKEKKKKPPSKQRPGWLLFTTGFVLGTCIALLGVVWYLGSTETPAVTCGTASVEAPGTEQAPAENTRNWEFFEIFAESEVPVIEGYGSDNKPAPSEFRWMLQAGSFRHGEEADGMRAKLILLGLDTSIRKTEIDGDTWHRVMVGPFESELLKNRALDKLAQAEIEALPMRLPR